LFIDTGIIFVSTTNKINLFGKGNLIKCFIIDGLHICRNKCNQLYNHRIAGILLRLDAFPIKCNPNIKIKMTYNFAFVINLETKQFRLIKNRMRTSFQNVREWIKILVNLCYNLQTTWRRYVKRGMWFALMHFICI
jgi:hypothetical protein